MTGAQSMVLPGQSSHYKSMDAPSVHPSGLAKLLPLAKRSSSNARTYFDSADYFLSTPDKEVPVQNSSASQSPAIYWKQVSQKKSNMTPMEVMATSPCQEQQQSAAVGVAPNPISVTRQASAGRPSRLSSGNLQ